METNKDVTRFNNTLVELNKAYKDGYITKGEFKEMYDFYVDIRTLIMR